MSTQEQARQIGEAFIQHFFDASKRTPENSEAYNVYATDSIARITRAKEDGSVEEVTLNGVDSVLMYLQSLPPSALTLTHYDAVPTHQNGCVLLLTGNEIIDIVDYQFSRTLVLAPTPQGGFYLKADMLHYQVGTPLQPQTEVIEVTQKKQRPIREKKPRQPRTQVPVQTEEVQQEQPQVEEQQQQQPEPVVEVPVTIAVAEPVVVVEEVQAVPVVVEATIEQPAYVIPEPVQQVIVVKEQPTKSTPTPQNSNKSWSQLVSGKENVEEPVVAVVEEKKTRQPRQPRDTTESKEQVTPKETARPQRQQKERPASVDPKTQAYVKSIPENTTKDSLFAALVAIGDIADLSYREGTNSAVVTFKSISEADAAIKCGVVTIGKSQAQISPFQKRQSQPNNGFRTVRK